ncbi:MAG: flagellar basal body rod protein FlgB [Pseudomonadota bacterium]
MSTENTIDVVRLALSLHETRAQVAGMNVARAGKPDATALKVDFASIEAKLREAASSGDESAIAGQIESAANELRSLRPETTLDPILLDAQIGEIAAAGVEYQALTEALSRQFGLMRIAIAGRV